MPRLIDQTRCPHCGAELPEERPRVCPECAGSLQQRYLRAGCISSSPVWLLLTWSLARLVLD